MNCEPKTINGKSTQQNITECKLEDARNNQIEEIYVPEE